MATLLGNPDKSASPLSSQTLPIPCGTIPDPIAPNPTPQHNETQFLNCTAGLRDIPTHVPTTAANPDADDDDDDDRYRRHSSIVTAISSAITPAFLQEWDAFYNDFQLFAQKYGASTTSTNEGKQVTTPAVPPANDKPSPIPALLPTLDDMSNDSTSASPSPNLVNKTASTTATSISDNNNEDRKTDERANNERDKAERSTNELDKDKRHDGDSDNHDRDSANCTNTDSHHDAGANNDCDNYGHGTINHEQADRSIAVRVNDDSDNNKSNNNKSSNNAYNATDCGMTEHDANAPSKADSDSDDCAIADRNTDNCSKAECNNTNHDNFQSVTETTNPVIHNNTMQKDALETAIIQYKRYVTTSPKPHNNTPMNAAALDEDDGGDQLSLGQRTLSKTVNPPLYSYAEWDEFYKDYVQSLRDPHPDHLQKIMPAPDDAQLINNGEERPRRTDKATKTLLDMQALTFANATVESGEQHLSNTITDSRTQALRKKILAQLEELQLLMLRLLQMFSQSDFNTILTCNIHNTQTHPTLSDTIKSRPQTPLRTLGIIWPTNPHHLKRVPSSQLPTPRWPPPQPDIGSIPAMRTPQLKHVRFKSHVPCSRGHTSWPKEDMRPP